MKKFGLTALAAAFISISAAAEETAPAPKTFTLSEAQTQDYASRLDREIQQAKQNIQQLYAIIQTDEATLRSLVAQAEDKNKANK